MKRPSFQFYPADWRNNANLRRCTWEARGVWVEVMGLLHDSDEYGLLRWPLKEIAQALGAPMRAVQELVSKGVLKGTDRGECEAFVYTPRSGRKDGKPVLLVDAQEGPVWYSSRMVRDEYVRTIRGQETRFGDDPKPAPKTPPKAAPNPPFGEGQGDGSTSSSTSTTSSLRSEEKRVPRKPTFDAGGIDLPEWIERSDWQRWCKDRAKRGKAITEEGARLQLKKLDAFRDKGASPDVVIDFAIENGHQGFFYQPPVPQRGLNGTNKHAPAARAIFGTPAAPEKEYINV